MAKRQPDVIQMNERRQLEAMVSARRHDIVDRLCVVGPLSIKELAAQFGVQPSSLYHHIAILLEAGIVVEAGTRMSGKRREQLYNTAAPRMLLTQALIEDRFRDIFIDIGNSLTRQMARDFADAFGLPETIHDGRDRNHGIFRLVGRPTAAQRARIMALIDEIFEILWHSGQASEPLVSFGCVLAPVGSSIEAD